MRWIIGIAFIIFFFVVLLFYLLIKKMFLFRKQRNQNKEIYLLLLQWLTMKIDGKSIEQKLLNQGIHNIIIYDMGILGDQLLYELRESQEINIVYAVDKNPGNASLRIRTKRDIDNLDNIDAIIVSDIFKDINTLGIEKENKKVILLSSLVYD